METDNKELKEETTKKEADKKETESKEETKQPVEETAVQKKKSKKWIGIVAAVVAVILLAYGGVAIYYQSHFLNHTYINNSDCSNMTATEVAAIMDQQSQQYSLQILGRDENGVQEEIGTITASEIGMYWVDTLNAAQELLNRQNEFLWIEMLWSTQNHDVVQGVSYDADKLQEQLAQMPALQNKNMIAPEDAYISEYSEKNKNYEIIPETMGIELNNNLVEEVVSTAIMQGDTTVDLEEQGCYETAKITAEDAALVKACDTMNKWVSAQITYDWNGNKVVVDGDTIHEWIQTDNKDPQLDEEAIEEFVAEQAKEYDTYGKKRKFTTVQGIELTLHSGAYGWKTDREEEVKELTASIEKGENIDKEPVYSSKGMQRNGTDDLAGSYIEVSLDSQHLWLYKDGALVTETDIVSGAPTPERETYRGAWPIAYKASPFTLSSEEYGYAETVKYWMPFVYGQGLHDASWQSAFGGNRYKTGHGSHGCINLPEDQAALIYNTIDGGYPIIIY